MGALCHFCVTPTHLSYRFSIFETSATALCGTTGMDKETSIYVQLHQQKEWLVRNPPERKVPRRGSLAADDTNRSAQLVQPELGGHVQPGHCWGSAFCISGLHHPNSPFRSDTMPQLGANMGEQSPNFGPTWTHLAPTLARGSNMPHLSPKSDQVELHMGSTQARAF